MRSSRPIRESPRDVTCVALALSLFMFVAACREEPKPSERHPSFSSASVLYVAPSGDDMNTGEASSPLRTIRAAVARSGPGEVVRVAGGAYAERVDFGNHGTPQLPITFEVLEGETAVISRGFRVTGNHNIIRGFTVTPGESDRAVLSAELSSSRPLIGSTGQIQVVGSHNLIDGVTVRDEEGESLAVPALTFLTGSFNSVRNVDIHHSGGISFIGVATGEPAGTCEHNTVSEGTVHHSRAGLVFIGADYSTIAELDLHDPGVAAPGQPTPEGDATDGINLSGRRISIRKCAIYNIFKNDAASHTDAIQWWNTADDLVIEGNAIGSRNPSGGELGLGDQGHIQFTSETPGRTSQRVIIRNNVFLGTAGSYFLNGSPEQTRLGQADGWVIAGNTFYAPKQLRGSIFTKMRRLKVVGNVFHAPQWFPPGGGNVYDYNAYVGSAPSEADGRHSMRVKNAGYVDPDVSAISGYGVRGDFRLKSGSPLIGNGANLSALRRDKAGHMRRTPTAIGAYEYSGEGSPSTANQPRANPPR